MTNTVREIVGKECILARYGKSKKTIDDVLLVKERIHYADGGMESKLVPYLNYKRDFYITKPGYRDHKQKKEWEDVANLDQYETTQARLASDIAMALRRNPDVGLRQVCSSPYVYGADISTVSIIKHVYKQKWPDQFGGMTLAALDYEADVLNGNAEEIISGSVTFKDKVVLAVVRDFIGDNVTKDQIHECFTRHVGHYEKERDIKLEIEIVDTPALVIMRLTDRIHKWQPDIVGVWNLPYDMNLMLDTLKKAGINPEDIFSDPSVPPEFRYFKWDEKSVRKERAGGEEKNKHYAELWHTASHLASFYFVDMMTLFCILRVAEGKRSSYALDNILDEEVNITKLKFEIAEGYTGLDWHRFMQQNCKLEYLAYNIFDCISLEILDETTNDVSKMLPAMIGISSLDKLDSNPRRLADDLHFYCLEKENKVMASTGSRMTSDLDDMVLGMGGWIVTLPSHLRDPKAGLKAIREDPDHCTDIFSMVSDLDVKGSYPTTEVICNISKETTYSEMCKVEGLTEKQQRTIGINMTNPRVNAMEVSTTLFGLPSSDDLLEAFKKEHC